MAREHLILDRYEPLGTAGVGGFGTVQIAWDPRIQRKVAIKTIRLTELDAYRANLPGAQAPVLPAATAAREPLRERRQAAQSAADSWDGVLPWEDAYDYSDNEDDGNSPPRENELRPNNDGVLSREDAPNFEEAEPVTSLAHLPGLDEARTAAMLDDPRIVTVYDFEIRERTAYLIMEYVEGITLTRLLAGYSENITLDMVTAVFDAVAGALMTAHDAGVLHLDIKPDNIMITPAGQVKVTDFGLATLADASGAGTTGGGTIGYMPLEQMRREHLDARTDEWSLAALTYEMLTGENPFRAPDLAEAEAAIVNAELILPSLCWDNVSGELDDVVFYALDPDRDERYASVADFAEEMDKFLGNAEAGESHLSWAVSDALGLLAEPEPEPESVTDSQPEQASRPNGAAATRRGGTAGETLGKLFAPLLTPSAPAIVDDAWDDFDEDDEPYEDEAPAGNRGKNRERRQRIPLGERYGKRTATVAGRLFATLASAMLAALAVFNMPFLAVLGIGRHAIAFALAAACGVGAALRPHVGALASQLLLGVALATCGHPIVAALYVIAVAAWWYLVGHDGTAPANVALLAPIAGGIGGASATPLAAGAALKPTAALGTTALGALTTLVLAACGSDSLLGWDALAYWNFAGTDVSHNLLYLIVRPSTWAIVASWLAAAAAGAFFSARGGRISRIVGALLSAAIVFAATFAFTGPDPQLLISLGASAIVLVALYL